MNRPHSQNREPGHYPERDLQDPEQGGYLRGKAGEAQRLLPGEVHLVSIPASPIRRFRPQIPPEGSSRGRVQDWRRMTGSRSGEPGQERVQGVVNPDKARLRRDVEEGERRAARCRETQEDRPPPGRLIGSHRPGEGMPRPETVCRPGMISVLPKCRAPVPGSRRPLKTWYRHAPVAWTC